MDEFRFKDAAGAVATVTADGCVDTEGQLGYRYDDVARRSRRPGLEARAVPTEGVPMPEPPICPRRSSAPPARCASKARRWRCGWIGPVSREFRAARGEPDRPARGCS